MIKSKNKIRGFLLKSAQKLKIFIVTKFKDFLKSFNSFLSKHYFALNLVSSIYAPLGIPVQTTLLGKLPSLNVFLAIVFVILPVVLSLPVMANVAETNPTAFVRTLKMRHRFTQLFWILAGLVTLLWIVFLVLLVFNPNYIPSEFGWILPALTFSYVGVSLLEAFLIGSLIGLIFSRKIRIYLRHCARAYFRVAANCLSEIVNKSKICNFKNGIENVNEYLKSKYGLQLLKGQTYYNYFRTIAFAGNEEEKRQVQKATNDFAEKLKDEINLNEVLIATRNICQKTISNVEDKLSEVDFEVGVKKSFIQHRESIGLIVAIISILVAIFWR